MNTVDELLKRPFSTLAREAKIQICTLGRDVPKIELSVKYSNGTTRTFQSQWYEEFKWMTASTTLNKLFCFPCMLFATSKDSSWIKTGFDNLRSFKERARIHESSQSHVDSSMDFTLFLKRKPITDLISEASLQERSAYNERVSHNRNILKRLIDVVCYLGKQGLAFRGNDESISSGNRGNYIELCNLISKFDNTLAHHLHSNDLFKGLSHEIQNDLITSVTSVLTNRIENEIQKARFISIQLDETPDVSGHEQLSVLFRYVNISDDASDNTFGVCERFFGYYHLTKRRAIDIFHLIVNDLQLSTKFDFKTKLVGQTYDGAAVMSGELSGLQQLMKAEFPHAYFMQCYSHKLNLVLSYAANCFKESRIFFANAESFSSFFSKSTKRKELLNEIATKNKCKTVNISKFCETRWSSRDKLVFSIFVLKDSLLEVFRSVIDSASSLWDGQSIQKSKGLLKYLNDFEFMFFLNVFKEIFEITSPFYKLLQKQQLNIQQCKSALHKTVVAIQDLRVEEKFCLLYETTVNFNQDDCIKARYKQLFYELIDTVVNNMQTRFVDLDHLKGIELFAFSKFNTYALQFPDEILKCLCSSYTFFNETALRSQLRYLYRTYASSNISNINELLKILKTEDISDVLSEVYKALQLFLTIAPTSCGNERAFSTLKRIKSYTRNKMADQRLSNLGFLNIEKDELTRLQSGETFYDLVIEKFVSISQRRMDFMYK